MKLNNTNFNKWAKSYADDAETLIFALEAFDDDTTRQYFEDTFGVSYDNAVSQCSVGKLELTLGSKSLGMCGWQ
jgi:hypothetical protein